MGGVNSGLDGLEMRTMRKRKFLSLCLSSILSLVVFQFPGMGLAETGRLKATRQEHLIVVSGDHFRIQIDATKGGEITGLDLFDGSDWNRVLGADGQTCPMICLATTDAEYRTAYDNQASIERVEAGPDSAKIEILSTPRDAAKHASPWTVRFHYEVYPEGALFIEMDWELPTTVQDRCQVGVTFLLDRAIIGGAKYRQASVAVLDDPAAFESARVAFGRDPHLSFTNEIQAILEEKRPLAGAVQFSSENGRFTWNLADGKAVLQGPLHYRNCLSLGLGSGAAGIRTSNLIGQRVYHWVNYLHKDARRAWYPTNEHIDKMAANQATILILHDHWMLNSGSNGHPHADYRTVRDEEAMRRTIDYAHAKGMRVGLYRRGIERYGVDSKFFEQYCRSGWDGFYVDWHGPQCVANHERHYPPDVVLGDTHFSNDGSCLAAREYFLFMRRLRQIVGSRGMLIGHQGFGASGVLANLVCDAYLPGEADFDHAMFTDMDQAVYGGMMGGGVCHPWTFDSPRFCSPEGIAKMAAWGFFPHVVLGMQRTADQFTSPLDPDDKANTFALPYWRILSAIDMRQAQAYNLPNQKPVAATCADENFRAIIYKQRDQSFLAVVSNLGPEAAKTTVSLDSEILGMSGSYRVKPIDGRNGVIVPDITGTVRIETTALPSWGIAGYRLSAVSSSPVEDSLPIDEKRLELLLRQEIVGQSEPLAELQRFCEFRIPRLGVYRTTGEWEAAADRFRKEVMEKVILRGEAARWRKVPLRVEWLETIPGGSGYQIKKLRYQSVPGLWIPAVLYEPDRVTGQVPVVLNLVGHEVNPGKTVEYQQIRCINLAKRGMPALSVEWLGTGQLNGPGFNHDSMNQLDLCGTSGLAPFYLSLERGLDLLLSLPYADPKRVAVTGLSGGGWQTCVIGGLDPRVTLTNSVAGYSSFLTRIRNTSDLGDSEQTPSDLATVIDYTHLTAMRAPRNTMLTYNSKDICFASGYALQPLLDAARPIFKLYNREHVLRSHVNDDPGTHNYDIDNRQAFYRMLGDTFYSDENEFNAQEISCADEVKTMAELAVALPEKNSDFNALARELVRHLPQNDDASTEGQHSRDWAILQRARLREIVRAGDYQIRAIKWREQTEGDLRAISWKFILSEEWSIPAIEFIRGQPRQTALLVTDTGRENAAADVSRLLRGGCRVLAVDPTFYGETNRSEQFQGYLFSLVTAAVGERPLGIEASQVAAIARWAADQNKTPVLLVSAGPRSSLALLVAATLEEKDIGAIELHGSLMSLKEVIEQNWGIRSKGPEFFCFGLLKDFDIRDIAPLIAPRPVVFAKP